MSYKRKRLSPVPKEWILKCPLHILHPTHYHTSGACRCDDETHKISMRRWGFRKVNGKWQ